MTVTLLASATYGFAIGSVHSLRFALLNLVKFPLLILVTGALCAPGYFLVARLSGARCGFSQVQRMTLAVFHDTAVMLAALAPASLFLAHTVVRPGPAGLGEYPLFLGLNVLFIALSGSLALMRQTGRSLRGLALSRRRSVLTLVCWLGLTLLVGGQWAWYLRPFFGVSRAETPFCLGAAPDFRGATNFYEAVSHLVRSPPLPRDYLQRPTLK